MSYVVGITGGSGSGKTFLLERLKEMLPPAKATFISQDDYYLPKHLLEKDENGLINFDLPSCIDDSQLADDIEQLKNGSDVSLKEYTFNNPKQKAKTIVLHPAPVIVVEGLFCFHFEKVAKQLDYKIFVDASKDTMLTRRLSRDTTERNYSRADVLYRFEHQVMPSYERYTKPYIAEADLIVDNNPESSNLEAMLRKMTAYFMDKSS